MAGDGAETSTTAAITASLTSSLAVILLVLWRVLVWLRKKQGHHTPPDIDIAAAGGGADVDLGPVGFPLPDRPGDVAERGQARRHSPVVRNDAPPPPSPAAGRRLTFLVGAEAGRRPSAESVGSRLTPGGAPYNPGCGCPTVPELVSRWQNAAWALPGQTGLAGRSHGTPESSS